MISQRNWTETDEEIWEFLLLHPEAGQAMLQDVMIINGYPQERKE
jgi:hypothetical protein